MEKCSKCESAISDNDVMAWKCMECGKAFRVNLSKLKKLQALKDKPDNTGKMLLRCPTCGNGIDNGNEKIACKCSACGNVMMGNLRDFVGINTSIFDEHADPFNNILQQDNKVYCSNCGIKLEAGEKFCHNCGSQINAPMTFNHNRRNKISAKKLAAALTALILFTAAVIIGFKTVPKLFVTPEELMAEGNYEKALTKAKAEDRDRILVENLIVDICNDIKESMKDPSSFELRNVWYEPSGRKRIVLYTAGKNSMGGMAGSLDFYFFHEGRYQMFTSIDNMDDEEYYSFDDLDDTVEKALNNLARICIREIRTDSNELDVEIIERINKLNEEGLIKKIKLLDEVKNIYPSETGLDTDNTV